MFLLPMSALVSGIDCVTILNGRVPVIPASKRMPQVIIFASCNSDPKLDFCANVFNVDTAPSL